MVARETMNSIKNLPVKTFQAFEGTLTRHPSSIGPSGGTEDVAVYSAPIRKGDLVRIRDHTDANAEVVERYPVSTGSVQSIGIAVSDPQGIDNTTSSGGTPAESLRRRVDVAVFGHAIINIRAGGTLRPGRRIGMSTTITTPAPSVVEPSTSPGEPTANSQWISLGHYSTGAIASVLIGYMGHQTSA